MSESLELESLISYLAELSNSNKGIEFFLTAEEGYTLDYKDRQLYLEDSSKEVILAVRYLNEKGKTGILSITSPSKDKIEEAVAYAKSLSEIGQEGIFPSLSHEYRHLKKSETLRPSRDLLYTLLEQSREALARFKKITRIEREILSWNRSNIFLIREGLVLSEELQSFGFSLSCVARGRKREASSYVYVEAVSPESLQIERMASWCAFKAEILSETRKGKSLKCAVVFPPEHALELLGILAFSLNGEEVLKGRSKLANSQGEKVFSEGLTIIDDGIDPKLIESRTFDDEGIPQQRTVLIERGKVVSFIWNSLTGQRAGVPSTGNARRPDLSSPPRVDFTNLYIVPSSTDRTSLLCSAHRVFMVLELLGVHTADPISGDFSFGASGILYERGEEVDYLAEMALSGNIFELFREVEIANDLTFFGAMGAPSLLFPEISLG